MSYDETKELIDKIDSILTPEFYDSLSEEQFEELEKLLENVRNARENK
jgi:hypothetical protein